MTWKILTLLTLATPLAMVILGLICWRFPPGGPNWILGFRSRRARAGDASWKFAQCWAGRLWFLLGLGWLVAVLFVSKNQYELPIEASLPVYLNMVGLQLGCLIAVILGMNLALLIRFDRFGRVRTKKERKKKKAPQEALPLEDEYEQLPEYAEGESADYGEEYPEDAGDEYADEDLAELSSDSPEAYTDYEDYGDYGDYEEYAEDDPLCDLAEDSDSDGPEWI